MSAFVLPYTIQRFFTSAGLPLAGGKLYSYIAGTTTPLALYTDNGLTVPFTNPIILDSQGSVAAPMFMGTTAYKILVTDSTGVTQDGYPADNIQSSSLVGDWVAPSYSAGNYFGSGSQVWAVSAGNVQVNQYIRIGNLLVWSVSLASTTLTGTPTTSLNINRPSTDFTFALIGQQGAVGNYYDGTATVAAYYVVATSSVLQIKLTTGANFANSAGLTYLSFTGSVKVA